MNKELWLGLLVVGGVDKGHLGGPTGHVWVAGTLELEIEEC